MNEYKRCKALKTKVDSCQVKSAYVKEQMPSQQDAAALTRAVKCNIS